MTEFRRNKSTGMGQGRNQGICRGNRLGGFSNPTTSEVQGICRGPGMRQGSQSNMPPVESVVDTQAKGYTSDLQMLKQQAERMTNALKTIQAQIEELSEK